MQAGSLYLARVFIEKYGQSGLRTGVDRDRIGAVIIPTILLSIRFFSHNARDSAQRPQSHPSPRQLTYSTYSTIQHFVSMQPLVVAFAGRTDRLLRPNATY